MRLHRSAHVRWHLRQTERCVPAAPERLWVCVSAPRTHANRDRHRQPNAPHAKGFLNAHATPDEHCDAYGHNELLSYADAESHAHRDSNSASESDTNPYANGATHCDQDPGLHSDADPDPHRHTHRFLHGYADADTHGDSHPDPDAHRVLDPDALFRRGLRGEVRRPES